MDEIIVGGTQFVIDRANRDDVPALAALLADDILGGSREGADLSAYRDAFADIDADPNQFLAVIRDSSEAIVGTFQLTLIPCLALGGTKRLQIEAVRLRSSARGAGLGSAMFAWAHDYGRRHGATLAQLLTDKRRADAHRFYDRLGYVSSHEGYKLSL